MPRTSTVMTPVVVSSTGGIREGTFGVHNECQYAVVNLADDATTVYNGPAILYGIYCSVVASAHITAIKDDTVTVLNLIPSLAAGANLAFPGVRFETSLIVDPDNVGTGTIVVFYKPL